MIKVAPLTVDQAPFVKAAPVAVVEVAQLVVGKKLPAATVKVDAPEINKLSVLVMVTFVNLIFPPTT